MYLLFDVVVAGIGGAMIFTPNYIAIGEYFDKNKGKAMGVATLGSGIGAIIMPPLWTFMFNNYGYFGTMLIVGGLYLNNTVAGGVFRKLRMPRVKSHKVEKGRNTSGHHNHSSATRLTTTLNKSHKGKRGSDATGDLNHSSATLPTTTLNKSHKGKRGSDATGDHNHTSATRPTTTLNKRHKGKRGSDATGDHNHTSATRPITTLNKSHKGKRGSDATGDHNHTSATRPTTTLNRSQGEGGSDRTREYNHRSTIVAAKPEDCLSYPSEAVHHDVHILDLVTSKLRLLCNIGFLIHALTIATIPFALQGTVTFLPSWADELGLTETQSSLLVMITGVTDIIGRIAFGFIFDHRLVINRRQICYKWVSILFGLSAIVICFCRSMITLTVACVFWGFLEAGSHGQRVTVVSEFVTAAQMPDAVGLLILFQGLGALLSPLVSGNIDCIIGLII